MTQGTLWQCEVCGAIHEAEDARKGLWVQIADPRREHRIAEAIRQQAPAPKPTAPTVTTRMVQIVLDTYSEHSVLNQDDVGDYAECAQCGTGSYGPHTIQAHATEEASIALQGALAAGVHQ